jgi:AcrR family transcriptional regulator
VRTSKKNIQKKTDTYHHGDLRNALLQIAVANIRKNGLHNLSLRDLARELGVSHAAPYRHFVDKKALLASIAEEGYERLFASMKQAAEAQTTIVHQLTALAWAYVSFCVKNPVHTDIMFGSELSNRSEFPTLEAAANRVFAITRDFLEIGQRQNVIVNEPSEVITSTAWSLVHGLAMLLKAKRMRGDSATDEQQKQLVQTVVQNLFEGILINKKKREPLLA